MKVSENELMEYTLERCKEIGQRIQELRLAKKLKLIDVAACLGIGRIQLYRIENGEANCTVPQIFILSQLLDCSVDYLLFGDVFVLTKEQKKSIQKLMEVFNMLKDK